MPDRRSRDIAVNRRAFHDYFVDETYEAGMALTGTEVKSLRAGRVNLRDGFVRIDGNQAWLENVHISPYAQGGYANHDPLRPRKLLLHAEEIASLIGKVRQRGYTLIPLRMYFAGNHAKVEVGLCRGKRQYDKREAIAERDARRQMERALRR
ncbi:MAG TPA: SsrA-binding protein SmpB [Candidatus Dormibacteraeota bacterium]|jgi:SsrA-binding protein|nr:SsrA-binding protein SmpB [Candidatus Dormibacteraeota bacterium]